MAFDEEARRGTESSCFVCRLPEFAAKRVEWGCDAPLHHPWGHVQCWQCREEKSAHQPYCNLCGGTGELPLHRCPNHYVGDWESWVIRLATLVDKGLQPFDEPPEEWPAMIADAILMVLAEKALIDRAAFERETRRGR